MAKKTEIEKTIFKITGVKSKGELTLVSVEFRRDKMVWHKAFQVRYNAQISLERFAHYLAKQDIEPTLSEKERVGELIKNIGKEQTLELPEA